MSFPLDIYHVKCLHLCSPLQNVEELRVLNLTFYHFSVLEVLLSITRRVIIRMGILFMLVNCLLCVQWPDSLQIYVVGYKEGPDLQNAKSICVHNILYITIYNIALYFALYIIFLI